MRTRIGLFAAILGVAAVSLAVSVLGQAGSPATLRKVALLRGDTVQETGDPSAASGLPPQTADADHTKKWDDDFPAGRSRIALHQWLHHDSWRLAG